MADHREAPLTLWTVIPPSTREPVLSELEVAPEAFDGLSNAADIANETAGGGYTCWIAIFVEDDQFIF